MTVEEFFESGLKMNVEIDELIRARDKAFAKACATAVNYDEERVQTSPGNVTENKFINYAEHTREIDQKTDNLYAYRIKMLKLICTIDNTRYRAILIARYINCDTWEAIAERWGFKDVRNVYILRDKALREISYKNFMSIVNEQ